MSFGRPSRLDRLGVNSRVPLFSIRMGQIRLHSVAVALMLVAVAAQQPPSGSVTPTALSMPTPPSLVLWLRPEELGACTNASIELWRNAAPGADSAPLRYDAFTVAQHGAPMRYVDPVSGSCVVRFTASQSTVLSAPTLDLSAPDQAYTLTVVARMWGDARRRVFSGTRAFSSRDFVLGWSGGRSDLAYSSAWLGAAGNGLRDSVITPTWKLYTLTRTSTGYGVLYECGRALSSGDFSAGPLGIVLGGGYRDHPLQIFWELSDCDVAEVLVYSNALPMTDRQAMEGALARRYGLSHRLPFTHPAFVTLASGEPVISSASRSASASPSLTPFIGTSYSPSVTPTASIDRCTLDESFAGDTISSSTWSTQPPTLVTVVQSATARGRYGATVFDPLGTGSPFAYLLSGTGGSAGNYTLLSTIIAAEQSRVRISASVFFDAGDELPFNGDAFVSVAPVVAAVTDRDLRCGIALLPGASASIACPVGLVIMAIPFASFGNPIVTGCSAGGFEYGTCHAASSASIVSAACLGRSSCSVPYDAAIAASCNTQLEGDTSLVIVADCGSAVPPAAERVFSRDIATVGAYAQSGWVRVQKTLEHSGTYRLTFGVRSVGTGAPVRASAFAVDDVLVCLLPEATSSSSASPSPSPRQGFPTQVAYNPTSVVSNYISAGNIHVCGVTSLNRLICWGSSNDPFWGGGSVLGQANVPAALTFANVTAVNSGDARTCVLLGDTRGVACFGWIERAIPSSIASGATPIIAVSTGHHATCAITHLGETICWGWDDSGANELLVPAILSRGTLAVECGFYATCAISMYRSIVCWGRTQLPKPLPGFVAASIVTTGWPCDACFCAISVSGDLACWGGWSPSLEGIPTTGLLSVGIAWSSSLRRQIATVTFNGTAQFNGSPVSGGPFSSVTCGMDFCCFMGIVDGIPRCVGLGSSFWGLPRPPIGQPFRVDALPSASAVPTITPTSSLTLGTSPSVTSSNAASATATTSLSLSASGTTSRSGSPPPSSSPTGTLTLRASASGTASSTYSTTASLSPSGTPYCAESEYHYFRGYDVDGNATLGSASIGSERECARACCDVPGCDAYAFSSYAAAVGSLPSCFFVGNVTGLLRNHPLAAGIRKRALL